MNDEIQKVLSKYEELKKHAIVPLEPQPAMIPVALEPDESLPYFSKEDALIRKPAGSRVQRLSQDDDMMDDLDEMIFGKKGGDSSEWRQDPNKQQSSKYDPISF